MTNVSLFLRDYKIRRNKMANKNKRPTRVAISNIPAVRTEFNPDYSTIKRDLTRIGILAGSLFAGLIILSFFIK
jgi:hypothetical protein